MVIDGEEKPLTMFAMVKATLTDENKSNSIIAYHDKFLIYPWLSV